MCQGYVGGKTFCPKNKWSGKQMGKIGIIVKSLKSLKNNNHVERI